jgi:hypothetical protein
MNIVSCCAGMDRNGRSSMSGISRPTAACGDGRNPVGVAPSFVGLSPRYPRVVPTLGSNTKALWACRESCATQAHVGHSISPRPTALRLPAHKAPKPTSGALSAQDQRPCVFQPTKHPSPRRAHYQSKTNGLASSSPQSTQAHVRHSISPRPTALRLPAHKAPKPTLGTVSAQDQRSCVFQPTKHPSPRRAQYQSKTNGLASSRPGLEQPWGNRTITPPLKGPTPPGLCPSWSHPSLFPHSLTP